MNDVHKVIIPVGGFGTRFLPATKAQPKEMLTLVDKPVIQYLVEEAVASGIIDVIFVTSRNKRAIEDHFDNAFELEYSLRARGKTEIADKIKAISSLARFVYVRQGEQKGPGDALLQAFHLIIPHEPVAVMYGDDLVDAQVPCLKQMIEVYKKYGKPVLGLVRVPKDQLSQYGVVGVEPLDPRIYRVTKFVEKPSVEEAPSDLISIGKYIYSPELFQMLPQMKFSSGGELFPTDIWDLYIKNGGEVIGYEFEGIRYDCGEKLGYLKATVQMALKHPEVGKSFKEYLQSIKDPA